MLFHYSTYVYVQFASEAGLPDGVFNVVTCSRDQVEEVGHTLCTSPDVAKISLTGSTAAGKVCVCVCVCVVCVCVCVCVCYAYVCAYVCTNFIMT